MILMEMFMTLLNSVTLISKKRGQKHFFLLCGMFSDDFDIPIERLLRCAWGLKLSNQDLESFEDATDSSDVFIEELISANLLIASDQVGCVKLHDLVRAFVLSVVSKAKHAWSVQHGGMSKWTTCQPSESYERISLTCTGRPESFLADFNYLNLIVLKLMHDNRSSTFPDEFYGIMKGLEIIAFDNMLYPMLPGSLKYSPNLQTLCFSSCSLIGDVSPIGNLVNLEKLSFARCNIRKLPSTMKKLKKLRLLDLTGCLCLQLEDGILDNLVSLEEHYLRVSD